MKIQAPRDSLSTALQTASRVVSSRATLPSLGGVMVTATDGVTLQATDMEVAISLAVPDATVEETGAQLVPARLLADVVRSLPAGQVTLQARPEQRDVEITTGTSNFHLRTLPSEDFPRLPEVHSDPAKLPAAPLAEAIDRVARAASKDEVRPILTGVLVQAEGARLTMVATDSYRLAVKHTALESELPMPIEANVPSRALRELARAIADRDASEVEIALSRNQIVFRLDGLELSSRLIEGQFPSWRQLIPESFDHEVRLPREELLEVCRRVSPLAQRNAPLRLAFSEGELTVAASTPDLGDASEAMPAPYSGEPLEIAFNPQFLIDGIESITGDELSVNLSSPLRPGLLRPVGDEDDFAYLVMPIRLNT
ncbi:MAG TPA: DNA polymerase III subunit beta [Solirubrobacterales bacterium]